MSNFVNVEREGDKHHINLDLVTDVYLSMSRTATLVHIVGESGYRSFEGDIVEKLTKAAKKNDQTD